jgi:ribosomal protein L7/L12
MPSSEQQEIFYLKGRISKLEEQMELIYRHLGLSMVDNPYPTDHPDVVAALRSKNMIVAIKIYRELTNTSLAEAKTAVEEIKTRLRL